MTADERERIDSKASMLADVTSLLLALSEVPIKQSLMGALKATAELVAYIEGDLSALAAPPREGGA